MKPCELTAQHVAVFARLIVSMNDYALLSETEKLECAGALSAAKAFAAGYTGLDIESTELEDVSYAVLTIAAEMIDNHQITSQSSTQYTGQNPTAMQILNMHSTNLLPSTEET